ncbi:hypothetical protein ES705_51195 [subsurface metagenome]
MEGVRAYYRFDLCRILTRKYPKIIWFKLILSAVDTIFNLFGTIYRSLTSSKNDSSNNYLFLSKIDQPLDKILTSFSGESLFKRSAPDFQWMMDYPWVSNSKRADSDHSKYYFSQYSKDFKQWFIRVDDNAGHIVGFMILTRHKGELKTPYLYADSSVIDDIAIFLIEFLRKHKIPTLVTHHPELVKHIRSLRRSFLYVRKSVYGFITSRKIISEWKDELIGFREGDGDGAFT